MFGTIEKLREFFKSKDEENVDPSKYLPPETTYFDRYGIPHTNQNIPMPERNPTGSVQSNAQTWVNANKAQEILKRMPGRIMISNYYDGISQSARENNISPGEALNDWLSGTRIEYRYNQAFTPTPNEWCEVSTAFKWWDDKRFEYRVKV